VSRINSRIQIFQQLVIDVFLRSSTKCDNCIQDKCKEYLIILLYCALSVTPGFLAKDAFEFAFLHAINLVEAGKKVEDKRIGIVRC
jgi:hypothetical protein